MLSRKNDIEKLKDIRNGVDKEYQSLSRDIETVRVKAEAMIKRMRNGEYDVR